MSAASDGNYKRLKSYFPKYKDIINDVDKDGQNVMVHLIDGKGDFWDKKKMIELLIKNGFDIYFEIKLNTITITFYDL